MTPEERAKQNANRRETLRKLLELDAANAVVAISCLLLIANIRGGRWRGLWWHFKFLVRENWRYWKRRAWFFWHKKIRGLSEEKIDELIDLKYS